jgi:hypothetical protein
MHFRRQRFERAPAHRHSWPLRSSGSTMGGRICNSHSLQDWNDNSTELSHRQGKLAPPRADLLDGRM